MSRDELWRARAERAEATVVDLRARLRSMQGEVTLRYYVEGTDDLREARSLVSEERERVVDLALGEVTDEMVERAVDALLDGPFAAAMRLSRNTVGGWVRIALAAALSTQEVTDGQ